MSLVPLLAGLRRRDLTLAGVAALLCFALYDWFFRPVGHGLDVIGAPVGRDFISMWSGPRLALSGHVAVLFNVPAYGRAVNALRGVRFPVQAWSYPPQGLLLFAPFSLLPYMPALALWTALGLGACLAAAVSPLQAEQRVRAGLLILASPAAVIDVMTGQNGALTAALLIGGLTLMDRRPWLAGVLFGVLTFKPQMGLALALVLLALGAWRVIASAAVTALLLAGAATLAFGVEAWRGYVAVSIPYSASVLALSHGGQKLLFASLTSALTQGGWALGAALKLQAVVAVGVLGVLAVAVRRRRDLAGRIALTVAATPLVTPYAWSYDLVALGAVMAWRLTAEPGERGWRAWLWTAGYLLPALSMLVEIFAVPIAPAVLGAVFAGLAWEALRGRRRIPTPLSVSRMIGTPEPDDQALRKAESPPRSPSSPSPESSSSPPTASSRPTSPAIPLDPRHSRRHPPGGTSPRLTAALPG